MRFRARGVVAGLGLVLGIGAGTAWAESPPCPCRTDNQKVVSEVTCLHFALDGQCGGNVVQNRCGEPVTLLGWPASTCEAAPCDVELRPWDQAYFDFAEEEFSRVEEATFQVRKGDTEFPVTLSAEVTCRATGAVSEGRCAAAPGSLAALALLGLVGTLVRKRRQA